MKITKNYSPRLMYPFVGDLALNAALHKNSCGVVKFTHKETGHFYFIATKRLYSLLLAYASRLRGGKATKCLQELFDRSPIFRVEYFSTEDRRAAKELKAQKIDEAGNVPELLNKVNLSYWDYGPRPVKVADRVFPSIRQAGLAIGISNYTVKSLCESAEFPLWTLLPSENQSLQQWGFR